MPTTRPRHMVTETDQVARALDKAARRWPELASNRARLLLRLVEEGERCLAEQGTRRRNDQVARIARTSGALDGVYGPGYLERLRSDWDA